MRYVKLFHTEFAGLAEALYIAMNGVYENAVLTALKGRSNLSEIVICTDNDIGCIDVADRLKDFENSSEKIGTSTKI